MRHYIAVLEIKVCVIDNGSKIIYFTIDEGLDGGVTKSVINKIMDSKSATDMKKAKSIKTTFGWMGFPKSVIDKIVGNKPINNTNFAKSL